MEYDNYLDRYKEAAKKAEEGHYTRKQHNIMALVGNGFDIKVLEKYRPDDAITTRYEKFFDFLTYDAKNIEDNSIYKQMRKNRDNGKQTKNWADFEELLPSASKPEITQIQEEFSKFLNEVVTVEIQNKLGQDATNNKWAIHTMSRFLDDINKEEIANIKFTDNVGHYHVLNYLFMNFNYTDLLDNYLYLDKNQFDPHEYKSVDTNLRFYTGRMNDGLSSDEKACSTDLVSRVVHPHGRQSISRSLLFGTNDDGDIPGCHGKNLTSKKYWAQYNVQYANLFDETELFIIYGMSIGETDKWWWRKICEALAESEKKPELIIYNYGHDKDDKKAIDDMKNEILKFRPSNVDADSIKDKIFIVNFTDDDDPYFLSLKDVADSSPF